jgi:hypothetical protein
VYTERYGAEVLLGNIAGVVVADPLSKDIVGELILQQAYKVKLEFVVVVEPAE